MHELCVSDIVRSVAGRDAGALFFVLRLEDGYAFLADGKLRSCDRPKKKKLKHLRFVFENPGPAALELRPGEAPTNREIRKALAICRAEPQNVEEGR